jgi:hypothetical protein
MNIKLIPRFALLLALIPALISGRQQTVEPKDSETKLLSRKVEWIEPQSTEVIIALKVELSIAQLPGGIFSVWNCGQLEPTFVPAKDSTLRDELNRIAKIKPEYQWALDDGVLNYFPKHYTPSPLDFPIAEFKADNVTAVEAYNKLFDMPEVKTGLANLGLHEPPVQLIFGGGGPVKDQRRITVNLKNVTLLKALNAIVRADGSKTWILSVTSCNGDNIYQHVLVN